MGSILHDSTILVADDDPAIGLLLRDILEPTGATVQIVHTGNEALAILDSSRVDLAILDIQMPGSSGLDILLSLRNAGNNLPVVLITGDREAADSVYSSSTNQFSFVDKPFEPDTMLAVVKQLLHSK